MITKEQIQQAAEQHVSYYKSAEYLPEDKSQAINASEFDFAAGAEWVLRQIEANGDKTIAYILLDRLECDPLVERLTIDTQTRAFWPEWIPESILLLRAIVAEHGDGKEDEYQAAVKAHIAALATFLKEKSK